MLGQLLHGVMLHGLLLGLCLLLVLNIRLDVLGCFLAALLKRCLNSLHDIDLRVLLERGRQISLDRPASTGVIR